MPLIQIDASPAQIKRLRKGHKVRVKKGTGFCIQVNPHTYNLVSRTFAKKKGSELQLTPEEIEMNRGISPEAHNPPLQGSGLWDDLGNKIATNLGRLADKGTTKLENMIGEGLWDDLGNKIATNLGRLADKGTTKLENMIGEGMHGRGAWDDFGNKIAGNLGRLADKGTTKLEHMIGDGVPRNARPVYNLHDKVAKAKLQQALNEHLGTNYGYLNRAGLDNAISGAKSAAMAKLGIDSRKLMSPVVQGQGMPPPSRMVGGELERASVGRNGGMLSTYTPPALVSQPFSANFQFQHFLPPQYQHFNSGGEFDGQGFH